MRIVQHTFNFGLGGIQKAPCVFARELAARGHEVYVLAEDSGPRFRSDPGPGQKHVVLGGSDPALAARAIDEIAPDVVHFHRSHYVDELVRRVAGRPGRVVVSTPVFGRPPDDRGLLEQTRTCLVGCYTFYRFCRWTNQTGEAAIARGVGYVPITPFEPPATAVFALDDSAAITARRAKWGIGPGAFVIGRVGRNDAGKWSPLSEPLVDALLGRFDSVVWLSIGYPESMGRERLAARWGSRFVNLPETSDYGVVTEVLASLDVQAFFSRGECFASSIAEAAGVGVPTVALATPLLDNGQAEQAVEGVTGRLVGGVDGAVQFVAEMAKSPERLAALKASTARHAAQRWHVRRSTDDLLALYEHWLNPGSPEPAYAEVMRHEHAMFAAEYRRRMAELMGGGAVGRAKQRVALALAESWPAFRAARWARQMRR